MLSDIEFRILLDHLDRPWKGFRKVRKGVKKRLRRHMQAMGCSTVDRYILRLSNDPAARSACEGCLGVTISRFFRDRRLWQALHDRFLPDLVGRFGSPIRVWSAGCAGGEEPYSLAILWKRLAPGATLDLLATDADDRCLERARAGVYTPSSLKEVPGDIRESYFATGKGGRRLHLHRHRLPEVRWRRHDLFDPPPEPGPFHLVLMRNNLLTYYRGERLKDAFARIVRVLAPGGCLATGSHERLQEDAWPLDRDADCPWVYRRKG
ncbi:MAG TPA: CheR family methyltransferase [Desulfosarcina sp.]|nr:CheR family methyltransferase [Desulfosarcina sp.]